jgi:hypothetical protein
MNWRDIRELLAYEYATLIPRRNTILRTVYEGCKTYRYKTLTNVKAVNKQQQIQFYLDTDARISDMTQHFAGSLWRHRKEVERQEWS